ncbi:MAG: FtsJ-like methyltransferase family protein [Candidatus Aenigmatarchaeota archaeon]
MGNPTIILHVPKTHLTRFEKYFPENYLAREKNGFIYVKNMDPYIFLEELKRNGNVMWRYINRVYYFDSETEKYNDLINLEGLTHGDMVLRVQAWPSELEERLLEDMDSIYNLNPKTFDHFLSVVEIQDKFLYGLYNKDLFYRKPKKSNEPINRSYYKLKEAVNRFNIDLKSDWTVLDIGASPGGWTEYLSDKVGKVVSVDPGKMKIEGDNIIHIPEMVEDCTEELEEHAPFDMVVSDINQNPVEYSEILKPVYHMLKDSGPLVSTIKLVYRGGEKKKKLIEETREELGKDFKDIDIDWLFSNTKLERTLFAKKR